VLEASPSRSKTRSVGNPSALSQILRTFNSGIGRRQSATPPARPAARLLDRNDIRVDLLLTDLVLP